MTAERTPRRRRQDVQLVTVREILRASTSALPLDELLAMIANMAIIVVDATTSWVMLATPAEADGNADGDQSRPAAFAPKERFVTLGEHGSGELRTMASRGELAEELGGLVCPLGAALSRLAIAAKRPLVVQSAEFSASDPLLSRFAGREEPVILLPLSAGGQLLGLLGIALHPDAVPDLSFLETLAEQAATAIESARLREEALTWRRRLDAVFERMAEAVLVYSGSGQLILLNASAAHLLDQRDVRPGDTYIDLVRKSGLQDIHRQGFDQILSPAARAMRGERVENAEQLLPMPDGSVRHLLASAVPLRTDGRTEGAVVVWRDITLIKSLAEASILLTSTLDYQATLGRVAQLAVPYLADWCAVHVIEEDGEVRLMGTAKTDGLEQRPLHEMRRRYPADRQNVVERVLRTGESELVADVKAFPSAPSAAEGRQQGTVEALGARSYMVVPLLARGRTFGALTFAARESARQYGPADLALAEELGRRAALAVDNARLYDEAQRALIARDRALSEAEAERDRLQQVVGVLPEGILIVDLEGRFVVCNPAAQDILGLNRIGQHLPDSDALSSGVRSLAGSRYPAGRLPLRRALREGEIVRGEQLVIRNAIDGRDLPILVNSAPLRNAVGSIVGAVGVFQDITTIKEFERTRDDFLASVSHELRTPLTSIKGFAQTLARRVARTGLSENEWLTEGLTSIDAATTKMTGLIGELLDLARLQTGRPLDLDRRPVDIVKLARQMVDEHQKQAMRHQLQIESDLEALEGTWDPTRIERVLANVLSNAIKYSPTGGEITVSVRHERTESIPDRWAKLSVRDQGIGIPPADLPHVFERFHRGANVTGRIAGTGIGLSGVRQIVEQHRGTIAVESKENEGTTITIRLPLYVDLDG
ncbi:MAG: ATP-binding protein [Dehalococcoidia bacterium]